jgi:hypothetical protein
VVEENLQPPRFLLKNNEFYAELLAWTGEGYEKWAWGFFIPVVILLSQLFQTVLNRRN